MLQLLCVLCICMCIDHCDTVWSSVAACDAVLCGYTQYYVHMYILRLLYSGKILRALKLAIFAI